MSIRKIVNIADWIFKKLDIVTGFFTKLRRRWDESTVEKALDKTDPHATGLRKLIVRIIKQRNKRRDSS